MLDQFEIQQLTTDIIKVLEEYGFIDEFDIDNSAGSFREAERKIYKIIEDKLKEKK